MPDTTSIVVAVVSLVASIASAGFTGWISFYMDRSKQRSAAQALTNKYRDPLTLSAYDLQSRLYNLTDGGLLYYLEDEEQKDQVQLYTAFLIGQYFSWVFIFRRQAQFLRFSTDATNAQLNQIMARITSEFSTDGRPGACMLWRGQQMAIGEVMTSQEDERELYCIGFAEFVARYKKDPAFRQWFEVVAASLPLLAMSRASQESTASHRLRRLQHHLIDLVRLLGPDLVKQAQYPQGKVRAAPHCSCSECPGRVRSSGPPSRNQPGPRKRGSRGSRGEKPLGGAVAAQDVGDSSSRALYPV